MRILFLAHRTPYPPNKGEKIRAYHFLSHLAKSHEVTLLYWVDDPRDLDHTAVLRSLCRGRVVPIRLNRAAAMIRAIQYLVTGRSFTEGYYNSKLFQREVEDVLRGRSFDVAYLFSSAVANYAKTLDSVKRIVDFVDVDSEKWGQLATVSPFPLSLLYRLEEKRLGFLEISVSKWADASLFVSTAEAELFKKKGGVGYVESISNGTDLELRRLPLEHVPFEVAAHDRTTQPNTARLIFVGTMDYYPNVDAVCYFAHEILPLIRRQVSGTTFEIVGRNPAKSVLRLSNLDGVRVVGEVENVRSYLIHADVSVAPLRIARGVQNKVLEAMALGVPVVATPAAVEGIEVQAGEEVLVGKTPDEFAAHVLRLLIDSDLRKNVTKKASHKMNQFYNWDAIGRKLERLICKLPCLDSNTTGRDDVTFVRR